MRAVGLRDATREQVIRHDGYCQTATQGPKPPGRVFVARRKRYYGQSTGSSETPGKKKKKKKKKKLIFIELIIYEYMN